MKVCKHIEISEKTTYYFYVRTPEETDKVGSCIAFHCETGPAIITVDGGKRWFLKGKELTETARYCKG